MGVEESFDSQFDSQISVSVERSRADTTIHSRTRAFAPIFARPKIEKRIMYARSTGTLDRQADDINVPLSVSSSLYHTLQPMLWEAQ